jgi:hypothetical protein
VAILNGAYKEDFLFRGKEESCMRKFYEVSSHIIHLVSVHLNIIHGCLCITLNSIEGLELL